MMESSDGSERINMGRISNPPQPSAVNLGQTNSPWYQAIVNSLSGRKTYIVAGAMIVYAVLGVYLKDMQPTDAGTVILQALGIAGLRAGISSLSS